MFRKVCHLSIYQYALKCDKNPVHYSKQRHILMQRADDTLSRVNAKNTIGSSSERQNFVAHGRRKTDTAIGTKIPPNIPNHHTPSCFAENWFTPICIGTPTKATTAVKKRASTTGVATQLNPLRVPVLGLLLPVLQRSSAERGRTISSPDNDKNQVAATTFLQPGDQNSIISVQRGATINA